MKRREKNADTTTPPLSFQDSRLPTPPPTDEKAPASVRRILRAIERHKRGWYLSNDSWLGFCIDANEFCDLERRFSEDEFCRNKLRCGYFPLQRLFVIRMPTRVHERFLLRVHDEIRLQLRRLAEGPSSDFAKDVEFDGSTTYKPADPEYGRHDPDGSFRHVQEGFPGVVIEAAYSQQGKMLRDLAEDYILGSDLRVRVMVGFDLSYRKKEATLSVWRPQLQSDADGDIWSVESNVKIFRHEDGEPNLDPEAGLLLHLQDFASVEFCEKFGSLEGNIFISCNSLYAYLIEAEAAMHLESRPDAPRPAFRKRRRPRTPEEELGTDDERNVVEAEKRAAKRVDRDDSSYRDSSIESENG